ncbi:hypothetical protein ACFL3S_10770, partial [Gemmatimonadota bacterium]
MAVFLLLILFLAILAYGWMKSSSTPRGKTLPSASGGPWVTRGGRGVRADEAFHASNSGDLDRMLRAMRVQTNLIDRHFLLQNIVQHAYKLR